MSGLSPLDAAWLEAAGDEYRIHQSRAARRTAFLAAAEAIGAVIDGDMVLAMVALMEASRAADKAFPPGSELAVGFALFLADVGEDAFGRAA